MQNALQRKTALYELCAAQIQERVNRAQAAMDAAQDAANTQEKSSAGDKYETGRAMMHLERDKAAAQLAEGLRMQQALARISWAGLHEKAQAGSVLHTNQGNFFLSLSVGELKAEGTSYFGISVAAPLGALLLGKEKGDAFEFRGRSYSVLEVF